MQYVLNSENSQRKTGIYLKLNLGLKALLVINGLMSWVLSDRGMLCSEITQHYGLWEEICFLCALNFSWWVTSAEVWFPTQMWSPSQSTVPCSEELEKCVLEGWGVDCRYGHLQSHPLFLSLISHSMLKSFSYINLGKDDLHLKAAIWLLTSRFKERNIQGVDFIWGPKTIRINSWIYQKVFPANISFITE